MEISIEILVFSRFYQSIISHARIASYGNVDRDTGVFPFFINMLYHIMLPLSEFQVRIMFEFRIISDKMVIILYFVTVIVISYACVINTIVECCTLVVECCM